MTDITNNNAVSQSQLGHSQSQNYNYQSKINELNIKLRESEIDN